MEAAGIDPIEPEKSRPRPGLLLVGAIVALIAVGVGIFVATSSSSSSKVGIGGTMTLNDDSQSWLIGEPCGGGTGGYSDIREGASVTVRNEKGEILATGGLQEGFGVGEHACLFGFAVGKVPKAKFYSVEVSHRGAITEPATDVKKGILTFALTLGN